MSLGQNTSFFKVYAKNGYLEKINPEYRGIAKKFYNQKKQLNKVEGVRKRLDKQIAYMQRIQRKVQYELNKKKHELLYTKDVTKRFNSDLKNRQSYQHYNTQLVKQNRQKAGFLKSQSTKKIQQAKQYILSHKRSLAQINKSENKRIQQLKSLKKAKEWDDNRSRVSQIYTFQKNLKESCNKFYKQKNNTSMKLYQSRISSFRQKKDEDVQKIQTLQQKLLDLKNKYMNYNNKKTEINKQILRIKRQSKLQNSLIKSRMRSRSSLDLSRSQNDFKSIMKNKEEDQEGRNHS